MKHLLKIAVPTRNQEVMAHAFLHYPHSKAFHLAFDYRLPSLFYLSDCLYAQKQGRQISEFNWVKSVMPFTPQAPAELKDGSLSKDIRYAPSYSTIPLFDRCREQTKEPRYSLNKSHPLYVRISYAESIKDEFGMVLSRPQLILMAQEKYLTLTTLEKDCIEEAVQKCARSKSEDWIDLIFETKPMKNAIQRGPLDLVKAYK